MAQPVDLQNVLAKTQAAEKIAKLEKAQPDITQQQFEAAIREKNKARHKKIQHSDKADEVVIHREDKKKDDKKDKKKQDENQGEDLNSSDTSVEKSQKTEAEKKHIDIHI